MKTLGIPLEAIGGWPALLGAWRTYCRGKRRRPSVAAFEIDMDRALLALSRALLNGTYRPGAYRLLSINDPKPRLIAVAPVRDRVTHTAIYQALAPWFNKSLIRETYACLPGRGSHRAVLRFQDYLSSFDYLVHLDIHRYYPSVDHRKLRYLLAPRIRDRRIHLLLDRVLTSGWELYRKPRVRTFFELEPLAPDTRPHGLPIGNLTSQWWGNLYLSGLDHFIKRDLKVKGFIRYMDDLVLFAGDRATLRRRREDVRDWLRAHRGLKLNPRKGHIRPCRLPQSYLGHRVTRAGYDLGTKAIRRFRASLPAVADDPDKLERVLSSWRGLMLW